ncbi:SUKH superfamily protein [Tenacibaculum gallaicum]|uniref:SUKH superfamily protein n=1 Tax=Tenacibaculum gallaicum TaxID=561505 RepID=A0A3E0IBZ1_9FLAO|nr:SMI1/KNR4 family protein [Tenacibaculum gallaicum]REH56255.1 SUKH superfamily protein [Tenacibaculum gallaicum]
MISFILTEKNIISEDLVAFEEKFKFTLPETYKTHMLKFNGGAPDKDYFQGVNVAHFNPIKNGDDTLEENIKDLKDFLPIGYLPFAYDPGGNQICMDLNEGENYGKIYYLPMDMGEIEPELLADSFEEFLNGLSEDNDY